MRDGGHLEFALHRQCAQRRQRKRQDRGLELGGDAGVAVLVDAAGAPADVQRIHRAPGLAEGLGHHRHAGWRGHVVAAGRQHHDVDHARHGPDRCGVVDCQHRAQDGGGAAHHGRLGVGHGLVKRELLLASDDGARVQPGLAPAHHRERRRRSGHHAGRHRQQRGRHGERGIGRTAAVARQHQAAARCQACAGQAPALGGGADQPGPQRGGHQRQGGVKHPRIGRPAGELVEHQRRAGVLQRHIHLAGRQVQFLGHQHGTGGVYALARFQPGQGQLDAPVAAHRQPHQRHRRQRALQDGVAQIVVVHRVGRAQRQRGLCRPDGRQVQAEAGAHRGHRRRHRIGQQAAAAQGWAAQVLQGAGGVGVVGGGHRGSPSVVWPGHRGAIARPGLSLQRHP